MTEEQEYNDFMHDLSIKSAEIQMKFEKLSLANKIRIKTYFEQFLAFDSFVQLIQRIRNL